MKQQIHHFFLTVYQYSYLIDLILTQINLAQPETRETLNADERVGGERSYSESEEKAEHGDG